MQNYLDFVVYCKENIHEFDPKGLITEYKNLDIPHSDFEVCLVMFLLQKEKPAIQEFLCPYWNKMRTIALNQWTGRVIYIPFKKAWNIYLGQDENKNHFFFDSSDNCLCYYASINTDQLIADLKFEFMIQSNIYVHPKKLDLKFALNNMEKNRTPRKKKISKIREFLFDCEIECSDGIVQANRWHLCMLNDFFFTYISKYQNENGKLFLKDFSTDVFRQYLNFSLDPNEVSAPIIYDYAMESLKLGMFLQDYQFVKFVYDLIASECNEDSLENLNEEMQYFFQLKNNQNCKIAKMLF